MDNNICIVATEYLTNVLSEYINHQSTIKINSFNLGECTY